MRFWEIVQPKLKIRIEATTRFMKALPAFIRDYDSLSSRFHDFIEFRKTHPPAEAYSPKDNNFNNPGLMTKIKHVHLVHGKVIIFYKMTNEVLYLYAIVNHSEYGQQKNTLALVKWLNNIGPDDFVQFAAPQSTKPVPVITEEQLEEIKSLLWEMAADPDVKDDLVLATKGDFLNVMDFLTSLVPLDPASMMTALGGEDKLAALIKQILIQVRPRY